MPYIHGKLASSTVNGPGNRAVIWFQGCSGMNCPGCWNPDTHGYKEESFETLDSLVRWINSLGSIDGITFSGGEPMQQVDELAALVYLIKCDRPELSLGMYTGYTEEELSTSKFYGFVGPDLIKGEAHEWEAVKRYLDFAIMGRYNKNYHTQDKPLCGSSNQQIRLFSDRYTLSDFSQQTVEIIISPDAKLVTLTGFPSKGIREHADQAFATYNEKAGT